MSRISRNIVIAMSVLALTSCLKEKRETIYNSQEDKIDKYITSNMYKTYTEDGESKTDTLRVVYNGGSNRLVLQEGTGTEELKANGTVSFYYAGYTFSGNKSYSNLFVTNHRETADAAQWQGLTVTESDYQLLTINLTHAELLDGLRSGLCGVKPGEHCEILFSGKHGFGKKPYGIIPANSALLFEIWVEAIDNE